MPNAGAKAPVLHSPKDFSWILWSFLDFSSRFLQIETQATSLHENFGIWCQIASFIGARR